MFASTHPFDNPAAAIAFWMAVVAIAGLLLVLVPGLLGDSNTQSRLIRNRPDALQYALGMLKEGMSFCRETMGEGRHAEIYSFCRDGVLIKHTVDPQEDRISMSVGAEKRLEICIRNGKIKHHLPVTDEENAHAKKILELVRMAEATIMKKK